MSAISLILLSAGALATALGGAALYTARGVHRELSALRAQLEGAEAASAAAGSARVPAARRTPADELRAQKMRTDEIRAAVSAALAEERERELAEARAFWAAQEARDAGPAGGALLAGHGTEYEIAAGDRDAAALLDALLEGRLDGPDSLDGLDGVNGLYGLNSPGVAERLHGLLGGEAFVPRQSSDRDGLGETPDTAFPSDTSDASDASDASGTERRDDSGAEPESAELAAARRRHPSHPDFNLQGEPVDQSDLADLTDLADLADLVEPGELAERDDFPASPAFPELPELAELLGSVGGPVLADDERTVRRLSELADARTPLADVRPGPLGTLDIYAFADGTTLCMSPGHHETARHLADALTAGRPPVLLGGSGITGAYSLTFGVGDERVYTLADRIIASL